jgi:hypothetical protein
MTTRADLLEAISTAPPTTCEGYRKLLEEIAGRGPMEPDAAKLMDALAAICALLLRPRTTEALIPWFEGVSPPPQDLPDELLDELRAVASELPLELAARARDVLWEARRDADAARQAARDYAALVSQLSAPEHCADVRARVDRAFDLTRMMRSRELEAEVTRAALDYVRDERAPTTGRVWVADVLLERGAAGDGAYAPARSCGAILSSLRSTSPPADEPARWTNVRFYGPARV